MEGRTTRRLALAGAAAAFVGFVLHEAAAQGAGDHAPVHATPPTVGACHRGGGAREVHDGRPWVDADPTGGVAVWRPGMNVHPCHLVKTHLDQRHARLFAQEVRGAEPWPGGSVHCPADDGSLVSVYLTYADRADEVVTVGLAGCGGVSAPGRESWRADVRAALRPFPPHLHDLRTPRHGK